MIYHFFVKCLRSSWNPVVDCVWRFLFSKQLALETLNSFFKDQTNSMIIILCNIDFSPAKWLQHVETSWTHGCWNASGAPVSKLKVRTTFESHLNEDIGMLLKCTGAALDIGYLLQNKKEIKIQGYSWTNSLKFLPIVPVIFIIINHYT